MSSIANLETLAVLPPSRRGHRPRTAPALPHFQIDQLSPAELVQELIARVFKMPGLHKKQSRMASPDTIAFCLADEFALGPHEAFIDGHEFCHVHSNGSIHLTMPLILSRELARLGWVERHPITNTGILKTLVTVYAPRNARELDAVLMVIALSHRFAQGKLHARATLMEDVGTNA